MRLKNLFFFLLCFSVLSGCGTVTHKGVNGLYMPAQSFAHVQSIPVHVWQVEVNNSAGDTSVPEDFPFSLYDHALSYLSRKFVADQNGQGRLVLSIAKASVTKEYAPAQKGVAKMLDVGGSDVYLLTLDVKAILVNDSGMSVFERSMDVTQRLSISEHASIAEREEAQLKAIEKLFATLDPELEKTVVQDMRLEP